MIDWDDIVRLHGPAVWRTAQRILGNRADADPAPSDADRARWTDEVRAAYEAGQREIEVGSFVPARLLPQLADTAEIVALAKTLPGCLPSVLVPNLKGAERAIEVQAHAMLLPLSASHAHSLANLRNAPRMIGVAAVRPTAVREQHHQRAQQE